MHIANSNLALPNGQLADLGDLNTTEVSSSTNLTSTPVIIEQCNQGWQYIAVKRSFSAAQGAAEKARANAGWGTSSYYGFGAMFKSGIAVRPVIHFLNNIYDYQGSVNLKPQPFSVTPPRFVCVSPDTGRLYTNIGLTYDPWARCQNPNPGGGPKTTFYADGTAFIFICPRFFAQPIAPAPRVDECPVIRNNLYSGDSNKFYRNYQTYTILYELTRFYLGTSALTPNSDPKEVFDWNVCARYAANAAIRNPTNLVLYIACKFCFLPSCG